MSDKPQETNAELPQQPAPATTAAEPKTLPENSYRFRLRHGVAESPYQDRDATRFMRFMRDSFRGMVGYDNESKYINVSFDNNREGHPGLHATVTYTDALQKRCREVIQEYEKNLERGR